MTWQDEDFDLEAAVAALESFRDKSAQELESALSNGTLGWEVPALLLQVSAARTGPQNLAAAGQVESHGATLSEIGRQVLATFDTSATAAPDARVREHAARYAARLAFWLKAFVSARLNQPLTTAHGSDSFPPTAGYYDEDFAQSHPFPYDHSDALLLSALTRLSVMLCTDIASMADGLLVASNWQLQEGNISSAAFLARWARDLTPTEIEPELLYTVALTELYAGEDKRPSVDELRELDEAFRRVQAANDDPSAAERFQSQSVLSGDRWEAGLLLRGPGLIAASAVARAFVRAEDLFGARRILKQVTGSESFQQGRDFHLAIVYDEVADLLEHVNDALAEQFERSGQHSPGLENVAEEMRDGLRAIVRRIELQLSLGARETSLTRLMEMVAIRGGAYPTREAETVERLSREFGTAWSRLGSRTRATLVTVETIYSDMEPYAAGDPSTLAQGYTVALESMLRDCFGLAKERLGLGDMAAVLGRLQPAHTPFDVDERARSICVALQRPRLRAKFAFWTSELPAALQAQSLNIVSVRNRAAHGGQVDWGELRSLREILLKPELGLLLRVSRAANS